MPRSGLPVICSRATLSCDSSYYVDDGLKSLPSDSEAIDMICKTKEMCSKGGLHLHKFISNSKFVIEQITPEDRAKGIKDLDLLQDKLPVERALGIQWCVESDTFQFRLVLNDRPLTRRGILSTINSVYDPLGFLAPVLLIGKQILQCMCREQADWDTPLPEELKQRWEHWKESLFHLERLKIQRCLKPAGFDEVVTAELHHFSDASTSGYGQCTYLRLLNRESKVHCSLIIGKSRVAPLKHVTIPRLELVAALVSVKISALLQRELEYENVTEWFWTDSKIVLGYIANNARRFHVFVANRVQQIRDGGMLVQESIRLTLPHEALQSVKYWTIQCGFMVLNFCGKQKYPLLIHTRKLMCRRMTAKSRKFKLSKLKLKKIVSFSSLRISKAFLLGLV